MRHFGSNRRGCRIFPAPEQNDGVGMGMKQRTLLGIDCAISFHRWQVGHHHSEWFFAASLSPAQFLHCGWIRCITGQMESTDALTAIMPPLRTRSRSGFQSILAVHLLARKRQIMNVRAACGAGNRLSMEAAIPGIEVFLSAFAAHGEPCHCREWSVVRKVANNGEAWTALCAVDERVAVPSILRVDLRVAIHAQSQVGGDRLNSFHRLAIPLSRIPFPEKEVCRPPIDGRCARAVKLLH